ncbi:MAG: AAA family ATPase [Bosea sp. (in: a-proteobacteria)]
MSVKPPTLWLVAGPNGVGKTTYAFRHIRQVSGSVRFINLDEIARGLSPLQPDDGRLEAARIALLQIGNWLDSAPVAGVTDLRKSFTIETTLAGVTHLRTIARAQAAGWHVGLLYFAVRDVEVCIQRIARRVSEGGHNVPETDARRRFLRSSANFARYVRAVDFWRVFDNTHLGHPTVVSEGRKGCRSLALDLAGLPPVLRQTVDTLPPCKEV